jgi:hypothetical protein
MSFKEVEPLSWRNASNMKEAEILEWGEVQINTRRYDYEGAKRLHAWLTRALYGEGYQLVPVEPTDEWLRDMGIERDDWRRYLAEADSPAADRKEPT